MQPVVTYVALLRGVNVGGKNPVAMPALADCLVAEGLRDVLTYLQTGNAVFRARRQPEGDLASISNAPWLRDSMCAPVSSCDRSRR